MCPPTSDPRSLVPHSHAFLQVRKAIDGAPHLAGDAVELGLVDGALFRDQAVKVTQRLAAANTARLAVSGGEDGCGWRGKWLGRRACHRGCDVALPDLPAPDCAVCRLPWRRPACRP